MTTLALIRPDSWNVPLLIHVGGAMVLVGAILTTSSALAFARGDARLLRFGYWTLLAVGLPGYVVMRIGAEMIANKWFPGDTAEPGWIDVGYVVADTGALLMLIGLIVGGVGVYRLRAGKGTGLLKATMVLSIVLLASYVVAIWAMSAKPD
jgi:hypothetical protein